MTYPRWATERSDEAAAGRDLELRLADDARTRRRVVRNRVLTAVVVALGLIAVVLALVVQAG